MTSPLPSFPMPYEHAARPQYLRSHYIVVLQGKLEHTPRPLFTLGDTIARASADENGSWGEYEWPVFAQLWDSSAPWLAMIPLYVDGGHITRAIVGKDMIRKVDRVEHLVLPTLLKPVPELVEILRKYVESLTS